MLDINNKEKLSQLVDYYFIKENFYTIHSYNYEGYKWKAIAIFKNKIEKNKRECFEKSSKFFPALKAALSEGNNLLHYMHQSTLFYLINTKENEMMELFCNLRDSSNFSLEERLSAFVDEASKLTPGTKQKLSPCDAMTCLAIMNPDEYYIYRPFVLDLACKYLTGAKYPNRSALEKACAFHDLCNEILNYLQNEKTEDIKFYKKFLKSDPDLYYDENCHLLVQNIIYILYYKDLDFNKPFGDKAKSSYAIQNTEIMYTQKSKPDIQVKNILCKKSKPGTFDIEKAYKQNKKNSITGRNGEFVIFEMLQKKYGFCAKHVSMYNDKLHYDILLDKDGKKTFIEVKTVSYEGKLPQRARIYITQAEVNFSREKGNRYELYLLFYDKETGNHQYFIYRGDVTQNALELQYSKNGDRYVIDLCRQEKEV